MTCSLIPPWKAFQEDQPMGGVSATPGPGGIAVDSAVTATAAAKLTIFGKNQECGTSETRRTKPDSGQYSQM